MWETFSITGLVIVALIIGIALGACLSGLIRASERVELEKQRQQVESDKKLVDTQRQMLSNTSEAMLAMTQNPAATSSPRRSA